MPHMEYRKWKNVYFLMRKDFKYSVQMASKQTGRMKISHRKNLLHSTMKVFPFWSGLPYSSMEQWSFRLYIRVKPRSVTLECWRKDHYWLMVLTCVEMTWLPSRATLQSIRPSWQKTFFMTNNLILLDQPMYSRDLFPIENNWGG